MNIIKSNLIIFYFLMTLIVIIHLRLLKIIAYSLIIDMNV